eukprot:maker-scaffold22_size673200-snap-gene-5.52 protein:Tk12701 transcript:maker-scaffold22_size673200-snap-gene-5.52-mRNA-1 annotation:"aminopeptidase n-like"
MLIPPERSFSQETFTSENTIHWCTMKVKSALGLIHFLALVSFSSQALNFDYPLTIVRPTLVAQGEQGEFACNLGRNLTILSKKCQITRPHGQTLELNLELGTLEDTEGGDVSGLDVLGNGTSCGLRISSINLEKDIGEWSCTLQGEGLLHKGTFQLLTEKEGHLREVRIPRHLIPSIYDLNLVIHVNAEPPTADGHVAITLHPGVPEIQTLKKKIFLHSKQLLIDESSFAITNINGEVVNNVTGVEYDLEREFLVLHLAADLGESDLKVSMDFTVGLQDDMRGLYRSSYTDETNQTKYLAATQFEKTDARKAFPCLDEPNMKAIFKVQLGHPSELDAVSNEKVTKTENMTDVDKYTLDTFDQTPEMSTYLLAFLVSDFGTTKSPTKPDRIQVYHIKSKAGQAGLAAEAATHILSFYDDYFKITYNNSVSKLDMAAIPDFDSGAMENWGLVTYRESRLLYQAGVSAEADKDSVVEVIAHELAHQWFGNLVTMDWWTDLWLNEGFATYTEYIAAADFLPNNQKRERSVLDDLHDVFGIDALETAKPISVDVGNPYYDFTYTRLAYGKGGCLLRMIENFLGLDAFKAGVNQYLENFSYNNTVRSDLWNALDKAGSLPEGLDVATIMESYTAKEGYPVITVTATDQGEVQISQKRFFLNPNAPKSDLTWIVPINVAYPGDKPSFDVTEPSVWFKADQESIPIKITKTPFVLNIQQSSYYRVNYDQANWKALEQALKSDLSGTHLLNRAQILDDSFNLARGELLSYSTPMDISLYLTNETEFIPLQAALNNLRYLDLMLRKEPEEHLAFQDYLASLLVDAFNTYNFTVPDDAKLPEILFLDTVIEHLCGTGDEDCVERAKSHFNAWMGANVDENPTPPDLKGTIYKMGIQYGGTEEFGFLLGQLEQAKFDQDIVKILKGLGSSQNEDDLKRILAISIKPDSIIRLQDVFYLYTQIGKSAIGARIQFDWLKSNFSDIKEFFQGGLGKRLNNILGGFMEAANTQPEIDELNQFMEDHRADIGSGLSDIVQGIDKARTNMLWVQNSKASVLGWLEGNGFYESDDIDDNNDSSAHVIVASFLGLTVPFLMYLI